MTRLNSTNFDFESAGYGAYKVTYTTPSRGDYWVARVDFMPLIDETKNADYPAQAAWRRLREYVQCNGEHYNRHGEQL